MTLTKSHIPPMEKTLTVVCVELASDSTAAGSHLRGTLARLASGGFPTRVIARFDDGPRWMPAAARKAWRIASVVGRARIARPRGVLVARWSPFIALVSRRWTRRGLPLVLLVQGNLDDLYDSNPWTRRASGITELALASIRDATRVVTPSAGLAEWVATLRGDGTGTITVIPNGVDLALFEEARREAVASGEEADGRHSGPSHALFVGNLAAWQGIDTILAALADPAWPADLGLHVIGDGQLADVVRQSPDARVVFHGRRSKAEVARAVARATMTLATRHDDAASATGVSPFKVIEAAAAGTPCVVTRVPGQTELATDLGGSILIPPDDPAALAQAVARLHGDPALRARLSEDGRRGSAAYDWAVRGAALTAVIAGALEHDRDAALDHDLATG